MTEAGTKGVISPEELSLLSRAFARVSGMLDLGSETERNDTAAQLIHLFEGGQRDEEGLVRRTVQLAEIGRRMVRQDCSEFA